MKILEIGPYPPPYGGWSRRIKVLKEGLVQRGHECVILNLSANRWPPTAEYDGFRNRLHFLIKVWSYSRRGFALHVHINAKSLHQLTVALVCRVISWIWRRRMVLTVHGGPDQRLLFAGQWWLRAFVRLALCLPEHIICDSGAVRESIVRAGGAPVRVSAISPFTRQYLDEVWTPTGALAEFIHSHQPVLLCYAYVLCDEPSLRVLLEAMHALRARFPQAGAVLLGDGRVEQAWRHLAQDNALCSHVLWQGNLPAPLFLGTLQQADVFVRISPTDGVAASVLEALALDVPVVASRLENRPAGVLEYSLLDSNELVDKIQTALTRPASCTADRFVIGDTLATEMDLLEEVCGTDKAHCGEKDVLAGVSGKL